jgi:hypothetical protein
MKKILFIFSLVLFTALFAPTAIADHSWGNYHWARTSNPLTLKLGDNLTSNWDAYLQTTSTDWSVSNVLDTTIVAGLSNAKNCKPVPGRVEVCNSRYGNNGWLGIAQIWASGSHITQGTTKLNDTYFSTAKYNTPAWKNLVMCQEVGHIFGLDHQDENFTNPNLGTCMDYSNDPSTNQHPNAHDYEQLEAIYAHLDSTNTSSSKTANGNSALDLSDPSAWGKSIRQSSDKKTTIFERDLGKGEKVFTFVVWAS